MPLAIASTGDPDTALRHLRDVLEAKKERTRQPPNYPAANAYTGRSDGNVGHTSNHDGNDLHETSGMGSQPSPDAIYGSVSNHARGNQEMRKKG